MPESQTVENKSIRVLKGRNTDWDSLAKECVALANSRGGVLNIGIEDGDELPPKGQTIDDGIPQEVERRLDEKTENLLVHAEKRRTSNNGEYVAVTVKSLEGVASTSDGRYFIRVSDTSRPLIGNEVLRLLDERSGNPWESRENQYVPRDRKDKSKTAELLERLRKSDRMRDSVKIKSDDELLEHYRLASGDYLTNLGVLCVGTRSDRGNIPTAPIVQAIKFDAQGNKIRKWSWDDYEHSPVELADRVYSEIPDFQDFYEIPDGMRRRQIPILDEKLVRELLVNALVHKPYTQPGDITIHLHPDRLEVGNPGLLPIGVTPGNILHVSVRRNQHLAKLFEDLNLTEAEGSGMDKVFEILLSQGRREPIVEEIHGTVKVTVPRTEPVSAIVRLVEEAGSEHRLDIRERILLSILAGERNGELPARQLMTRLGLADQRKLAEDWVKRLPRLNLVGQAGRGPRLRYFILPERLRDKGIPYKTTLRRIRKTRLQALIREDLSSHPGSMIGELHERIGPDIFRRRLWKELKDMRERGEVATEGQRKWMRYSLATVNMQKSP